MSCRGFIYVCEVIFQKLSLDIAHGLELDIPHSTNWNNTLTILLSAE